MISQNKAINGESSYISEEKTYPPALFPADGTLPPTLLELIKAASILPEDRLKVLVEIAQRIAPD